MKKHTIIAALSVALMSTTALAAISDVKDMADNRSVTVTGTVDSVENDREFTLRDSSGKIDVDIASNQSVVLKEGDQVSVTGKLDKGLFSSDIDASDVSVSKELSQAVGDTIRSVPGVSTLSATAYDIAELPKSGAVKITGTVSAVENEKEFTLRDETGTIGVDIASNEQAAVTEGARVTVIGNMDSDALGKDVDADRVIVLSNAKSAANY